jgi:cobalt/nickel transport system permease protein
MTLAFELPVPPASVLRSFDPRWKIVATVCCIIVVILLRSLGPLLAVFVGSLLLCVLARLPWRWVRNRMLLLLPMLAALVLFLPLVLHDGGPAWTLGPVRVSLYGLVAACRITLKALAIFTLMLVLLGTTPLPDLFKAAHALFFPGLLIQLLSLSFRYLLLLIEEFGRLRIALRVRGFRSRPNLQTYRLVGNVTGTLLVRSTERAERVGQAMRCRGFDGRYRSLTAFRTGAQDLLLFVLILGPVAVVLWWDLLWRGLL